MSRSTQTHLEEIASTFEEATSARPTLKELLAILVWGLRSLPHGRTSGPAPATVGALTAQAAGQEHDATTDDAHPDLDDAAYTAAADLFADLAKRLEKESDGGAPTIDALLDAFCDELGEADDGTLKELRPAEVTAIEANFDRAKKRPIRAGDIVAIPVAPRRFRFAAVLGTDKHGLALGLFEGEHTLRTPDTEGLNPMPHPVHTGEDALRTGRWPVIAHNEKLAGKFGPAEVFHRPAEDDPEPDLGPYGAGENPADGALRTLEKAEADELGLLSGSYRQVRLEPELERWLADRG